MNRSCFLVSFFIFAAVAPIFAQETWDDTGVSGEIEDAEVVIEKDREIELPFQLRSFEKIPPSTQNAGGLRQDYTFTNLNVQVPSSKVDIKALKLEEEPLEKYYGNMVKLGYGNYASPLAELYMYNKRNQQYLYGVQAKHLSFGKGPVDGKNSASGETSVKAEASYFGKGATVGGSAFYRLSNWHYYGYNPGAEVDRDTLLHRFNRYGAAVSLDNAASDGDFDFDANLSFTGQTDNFDVSENWSSLESSLSFPVQDLYSINLGVAGDLIGYTDSVATTRQRVAVEPSVGYALDKLSVTVGFRYIYQSDTALPASQLYPLIKAGYNISNSLQLFAGLSGNNQMVTWQSLTDRNPYLGRLNDIHNANLLLNLEGGISGSTSFLSYKAGFSRSVYKQYAFFVNGQDDPSKFMLVYDSTNFKVLDMYGEAELYLASSLSVRTALHSYSYASGTFDNVPHLPAYKVTADLNYLFFNKVRARAGATFMGGIKGYDTVLNESRNLKPATDVYLHLDYLLSDRVNIFFNLHNVANQQYELLSNYPVRGFTFKAGFSYSF